ncbi:hypothetical protein FWH58_02200 [Candidatus Saccharibacteria bacterium]|nr:hypothetical protein [Candidatus Saccharibacteria bacterium]
MGIALGTAGYSTSRHTAGAAASKLWRKRDPPHTWGPPVERVRYAPIATVDARDP